MMFRVGQKVECINRRDVLFWLARPTLKTTYTVANSWFSGGEEMISLVEFPQPGHWLLYEPGYRACRFRPIVSRKTDISSLEALLLPNAKILEGV